MGALTMIEGAAIELQPRYARGQVHLLCRSRHVLVVASLADDNGGVRRNGKSMAWRRRWRVIFQMPRISGRLSHQRCQFS